MHISPATASPCISRQRRTNASASPRRNAGFLRLRPGIDLHEQQRPAALPDDIFFGNRAGELVAVKRMDGIEQRHRVSPSCSSAAAPRHAAQIFGCPDRAAGHLRCASCTRFSPKARLPRLDERLDHDPPQTFSKPRSAVTSAGSRPRLPRPPRRSALQPFSARQQLPRGGVIHPRPASMERRDKPQIRTPC